MKLTKEEFISAALPYIKEAGHHDFPQLPDMIASVQEKVETLTEIPDAIAFYLTDSFGVEDEPLEKVKANPDSLSLLQDLLQAWSNLEDWSAAKSAISSVAKAAGKKPGQLMFPVRIALSGKAGGPDLGDIIRILGKDSCVTRLQKLLSLLATT